MSPETSRATCFPRFVVAAALTAAVLSLALMAVRVVNAVSLVEPLHLQTSGDEIASLFAVWKWATGETVYGDRFRPPYNAVFFNWLFYATYGTIIQALHGPVFTDYAWLPTIARLFTLAGAAVAGGLAFLLFLRIDVARLRGYKPVAAATALVIAFGPLVGYWTITVRPDVWALAFEIGAATAFLTFYRDRPNLAVVFVAACCYAAWAFKQVNVYALMGTGLFLLLRRDWRTVSILGALLVSAWILTFALGGEYYFRTVFFSGVPLSYTVAAAARNLGNFAPKVVPFLAAAAAIGAYVLSSDKRRKDFFEDDRALYAATGTSAALLSIPLSFQTGAAENYYFTLFFFLTLLVLAAYSLVAKQDARVPAWVDHAFGGGWLAMAVACLLVFLGVVGTTDLRAQHRFHSAAQACLAPLPRPLFIGITYLSLPWMSPGSPPFVLSYVYYIERKMERRFESGGIGGLIASGYFATIVTHAPPPETIDGVRPDRYRLTPSDCPSLGIFLRRND